MVESACPAGSAAAAVSIALVLEAVHGRSEVGDVRGVFVAGGGLEGWKDSGACLVAFFRISLGVVVGGVGAEYSNIVGVLVAVGWWLVLVLAEAISY